MTLVEPCHLHADIHRIRITTLHERRRNSSRVHLVCVPLPPPWAGHGGEPGAQMVQQREPLSAAALSLWPALRWLPGLPDAPGSVYIYVYLCVCPCLCLFFYVSDTMVILPVLCWLPVGNSRLDLHNKSAHLISVKLVAQLQRRALSACIALINVLLNLE